MSHLRSFLQKRNELEQFLIKAAVLYICWMLCKLLIFSIPFLNHGMISVSKAYGKLIAFLSNIILRIFGYNTFQEEASLRIGESRGVIVVKGCLAYFLMSLYAGFIIVYPGKRKSKYWFIPLGIGIIIILNVFRITGMAMVSYHNQESMKLYHRYIFKTILHLTVFILWVVWVSKYGKKLGKRKES